MLILEDDAELCTGFATRCSRLITAVLHTLRGRGGGDGGDGGDEGGFSKDDDGFDSCGEESVAACED